MGAGIDANLRHDDVLGRLSIPKEWLKNQLSRLGGAEHLSLITGQGDSRSPTIKHENLVFVDQFVVEISRDGVYVFDYEGELYIKHLQRQLDGSLDMISDNEMYKTVSISKKKRQHLRVIGAIVGVMGWNKI